MLEKAKEQLNLKNPDSALLLAEEVLKMADKDDNDGIIKALGIKAKAFFQKDKYNQSVTILFDALRRCKDPRDNKHIAYLYGELGYVYYAQKHYAESKSYYYRQIDLLRKLYGTDSLADALINLATMHQGLKEFDSARVALDEAGNIITHNGNLKQQGYYYLNRGSMLLSTNEPDSAEYYYRKAYEAWNAIGYESQIYKTTFNLGYLAEQKKDFRKAIDYYHLTENAVKKFGLRSEIAHVYGTMAEAYAAINQYDSAYNYLYQYVVISDSITHDEFNTTLAKLDKQYQSEKNKETIHEQQLELEQQHDKIFLIITLLIIVLLAGVVLFGYLTFRRSVQQQVDDAKGRFFANVVHEIRTPLSMIKAPVKLLQEKTTDADTLYQLDIADRNITRLNDLVNQMLAISKIDATQYILKESLGDPAIFINTIADGYKLQAMEKQILMHYTVETPACNVLFDKDGLEKITANLLSNAIKYTPAGGNIGVELSKNGTNWTLTVWDTGTGIDKSDHEKIFSRFYRAQRHEADGSNGTGIGLSLVKELVLLMNGSIKVESEVGKGAVFTVSLPLNEPENNTLPAFSVDENAPVILVVEDDDEIRDYNKVLLQSNGYNVMTARNGNEATTLLQDELPDLIITDLMMPEKDGITLIKEIRNNEATDHIPIIVLSARSSAQAKIEGISGGAQVYLDKPFIPAELIALVKNQLQVLQKQKENLQQSATAIDKTIEERFEQTDPFTRKCYAIIREHLDDAQLSVEMLAGLMNINRSHFQRKIKTLTGYSPSELIKTIRLETALKMLLNKERNITETAYATGFTSQSYFTKCFSEHFGYPPSQASQ